MTDSHWLHRIVPDSYEDARWWQLPFWMLFGNDEGGIFGERDPYHTVLGNPVSYSFVGFLKWWARNPLHNVFWHVLRWDCGDNALVLYASDKTGSRWWFRGNQATWLVDNPDRQIYIRLLAPFVSYRGTSWEFYAGWRIHGALGFAFRRA